MFLQYKLIIHSPLGPVQRLPFENKNEYDVQQPTLTNKIGFNLFLILSPVSFLQCSFPFSSLPNLVHFFSVIFFCFINYSSVHA